MRRLLAILLAFGLVAAACGDDGTTDDANTPDPESSETDDPAPEDPEPEDPAPEDPAPGIELTDSYRGVTAETITIGVAHIDVEQLNTVFNIGLTEVPLLAMLESWRVSLNAAGGINGRMVEIESKPFLPVGSAESDAVCIEMMEDKEIFVVIGQFLQDNALCITESNGHPYVGHFGETPERQRRSNGLFFGLEINQVSQRVGGTQAMIDDGLFDGKKIAVVWQDPADLQYGEAVLPVLADAGVNVVVDIEVGAATTDTIDNEGAWDIAMERISSLDADIILNLSGIGGVLEAVERASSDIAVAHTNGQAADGTTIIEELIAGDETKSNSFAYTTFKPNAEEALADPGVQKCIKDYTDSDPEIPADLEDNDWVVGFTNWCRSWEFTRIVLEGAGDDITPDSFIAAAEGLGEFELPAMAEASISPDKHSAGSLLIRYEYSVEQAQYVRVGEPFLGAGLG